MHHSKHFRYAASFSFYFTHQKTGLVKLNYIPQTIELIKLELRSLKQSPTLPKYMFISQYSQMFSLSLSPGMKQLLQQWYVQTGVCCFVLQVCFSFFFQFCIRSLNHFNHVLKFPNTIRCPKKRPLKKKNHIHQHSQLSPSLLSRLCPERKGVVDR